MKPLGRKHYKNNTGGKHYVKIKGKVLAWWTDVIGPCKKRSRKEAQKEIRKEIDEEQNT
jgi:hypothetical protein